MRYCIVFAFLTLYSLCFSSENLLELSTESKAEDPRQINGVGRNVGGVSQYSDKNGRGLIISDQYDKLQTHANTNNRQRRSLWSALMEYISTAIKTINEPLLVAGVKDLDGRFTKQLEITDAVKSRLTNFMLRENENVGSNSDGVDNINLRSNGNVTPVRVIKYGGKRRKRKNRYSYPSYRLKLSVWTGALKLDFEQKMDAVHYEVDKIMFLHTDAKLREKEILRKLIIKSPLVKDPADRVLKTLADEPDSEKALEYLNAIFQPLPFNMVIQIKGELKKIVQLREELYFLDKQLMKRIQPRIPRKEYRKVQNILQKMRDENNSSLHFIL